MSILNILNVLLGLIFAWAILSLAAMNIQEWIAARRQWRAAMLHTTIGKMLTDYVLVDQFYNHPLIRSLFTDSDGKHKPSYITPNQFSQAMIDLLAATGTEAALLQLQLYKLFSLCNGLPRKKKKDSQNRISMALGMARKAIVSESGEDGVNEILGNINLELGNLAQGYPKLKYFIENALLDVKEQKVLINDALGKMNFQAATTDNAVVARLRAGIIALSVTHPQLKQTMYSLINSVPQTLWEKENELDLIRHNIEEWFNGNMNRLTGWYKRRSQLSLFTVGMTLALIINVDSINIARRLWNEPSLRQSVLNNVGQVIEQLDGSTYKTQAGQLLSLQQELSTINLPITWIGASKSIQEMQLTLAGGCTPLPTAANDIYGVMLFNSCHRFINTPFPGDITGWVVKTLGFLITAVATSQGASFWFDILKKIMNIRLTGYNPAETQKAVG